MSFGLGTLAGWFCLGTKSKTDAISVAPPRKTTHRGGGGVTGSWGRRAAGKGRRTLEMAQPTTPQGLIHKLREPKLLHPRTLLCCRACLPWVHIDMVQKALASSFIPCEAVGSQWSEATARIKYSLVKLFRDRAPRHLRCGAEQKTCSWSVL